MPRDRAIHYRADLLATEDADDAIDVGHFLEQRIALALREAAGDDHGANLALLLEVEHLADDTQRFLSGRLDEAAGVDDDDVGAAGIGHQGVAVLRELAEHALGVHEVLGTAEADERVGALAGSGHS